MNDTDSIKKNVIKITVRAVVGLRIVGNKLHRLYNIHTYSQVFQLQAGAVCITVRSSSPPQPNNTSVHTHTITALR